MKTFKLFVDRKAVEHKSTKYICDSILSLNLRKGDVIELFPFNHFDDEQSSHKGEFEDWYGMMEIKSIETKMIISWNSTIKVNIEIHLNKLS